MTIKVLTKILDALSEAHGEDTEVFIHLDDDGGPGTPCNYPISGVEVTAKEEVLLR